MTDRTNCFIFGDGAGAVVVGPTEDQQLGPVIWGSDGSQYDAIRQDIDWVTFLDGDRVLTPADLAARVGALAERLPDAATGRRLVHLHPMLDVPGVVAHLAVLAAGHVGLVTGPGAESVTERFAPDVRLVGERVPTAAAPRP